MAEARFRILHAGPHVSVQDGGRPGLARFGVTASGAMDRPALALANAALGKPAGAAVIEVSPGGLQLQLDAGRLTLALAGGGFHVSLNQQAGGSWQVLTLGPGDRLTIRPGPWGSWCYLAVAGDLVAPEWLGSRATNTATGLGGGRLATGGTITVADPLVLASREGAIPCPVWCRPRQRVSVVLGPQDRYFSAETIHDFLSRPFRLTAAYDRMGVRLAGPDLPPQGALAIPSEAIVRGAVQVAGDGVATVLLADHQTTGGYPKIATLAGAETDRFAQLRPGDTVFFDAISPQAALQATRLRAASLAACLHALHHARP